MDLPALSDIFFIFVFLIPGFVTLNLIRNIGKYDRSLSNNETIYWSVFWNLIIIGIYNWITDTTDLTTLTSEIFLFSNLFLLIGISLSLGIGIGVGIRYTMRKNIISEDCWELSMKNASINGTWIIVLTKDGDEFMGTLHYNAGSKEPREITIRKPTKIIRSVDPIEEEEWGEEILFLEDDIKRIVFMNEV